MTTTGVAKPTIHAPTPSRLRPARRWVGAVVLAILLASSAGAQEAPPDELAGGGHWKTDGEATTPAQQWSLDVQRSDDGTISGLITVADSPLFAAGRVHGTIDGRVISGTVTDEQGDQVLQFNGTLSDDRFRGKYVARTGESGEWEWEGPPPTGE
jgi:hypothetical protein